MKVLLKTAGFQKSFLIFGSKPAMVVLVTSPAVSDFSSLFLYSAGVYNTSPTLFFNQAGNTDLEWETSNKIDAGISFGLLKDRIQVEASYYHNDINGLVLDVPQAPSKGIPGNGRPANIGSMYNKGFEFTVTSYNISTKNFTWNTDFECHYTEK